MAVSSRRRFPSVWTVCAVVIAMLSPLVAAPAIAAPMVSEDLSATSVAPKMGLYDNFEPGNIISDAVFFNSGAMTEAEIQAFLDAKVPKCNAGYTCLKDFTEDTITREADKWCAKRYVGAKKERASRIISKVADACGVNPQVLLVLLQKEQGLVTHVWPSDWRYTIATGYACPDTSGCDVKYHGFRNQMYMAAWQYQAYKSFNWYPVGKTSNILYHPNKSCGSSPVHIANQATAGLYYYTPYQPNASALAAGRGTGDKCASYGNRNFYLFFTEWFGSTQLQGFTSQPVPKISGTPYAGQVLTVTVGTWQPAPGKLSVQWLRNGKNIAGATSTSYVVTNADAGTSLSVRVSAERSGFVSAEKFSAALPLVTAVTTERRSGADHFETAVAVSKVTHPKGAKTVYLATGSGFADALAAAPAAAKDGAALLLTSKSRMPAATAAELKRLAPERVYIVGGPAALDRGTEARIKSVLPKAALSRIAGDSHYATARLLASRWSSAGTVYLATGKSYMDALGAAAVAGRERAPIILLNPERASIDGPTKDLLRKLKATKAIVLGGELAVSKAAEQAVRDMKIAVTRVGGQNHYVTNANLNRSFFSGTVARQVLVTGRNFPDALTGSVYAAQQGAPIFLVEDKTCVAAAVADFARDRKTTRATLVGGPVVLDPALERYRRC